MAKRRVELTNSSGNVFRDVGFPTPAAEHLRVRAELMLQIEKAIRAKKLKQAQAAKVMGVSQPRVSDLLRGKIDLFGSDALIDMLARLGRRVRVVTSAADSQRVA